MLKIIIILAAAAALFKILFAIMEQRGLYHPTAEIEGTPAGFGIRYDEVRLVTGDGKTLAAWFVPAEGARWTLVYCHGNAGNISHRLHKVRFFHSLGMNFLIFDYRGFGKSEGLPSERGLYWDAEAAYDYLVSARGIAPERIVVYGKSLGGPVAAELAKRKKIGALILEGSFASVTMRAQQLYPILPMKLLVCQKFDTVSKVRAITVPKLIVHARHDQVISFKHGETVYAACAEPKQFLPFDGGHNDDVFVTSDEYSSQLLKFLKFLGTFPEVPH